jgi:hypothetical protein
LEEGLDILGSELEIHNLEGLHEVVDAVLSAHDDVNSEDGGVDMGLSKAELKNLVAYQSSEVASDTLDYMWWELVAIMSRIL